MRDKMISNIFKTRNKVKGSVTRQLLYTCKKVFLLSDFLNLFLSYTLF